jgi:glutamine amidotransferase PdxT
MTKGVVPVQGRVAKHDALLLARGGRKLNGIRLTPEAAAALAAIEAGGESATHAINRLLIEGKP